MKKLLIAIVILSFFGLALVSPIAMAMAGHNDCIASAIQGGTCPAAANIFGVIAFHLEAVKHFSSATVPNAGAIALASLLIYLFAGWFFRTKAKHSPKKIGGGLSLEFFRYLERWQDAVFALSAYRLHLSAALLENSPTIISF